MERNGKEKRREAGEGGNPLSGRILDHYNVVIRLPSPTPPFLLYHGIS